MQCETLEQIQNWRVSSRRENPSPAQGRLRFNMTMNHTRLRGRIVLLEVYNHLQLIKRRNVHLAPVQYINYLQKAAPLATAISWHTQCNALAVWAWMQWCTWENWPGWAGEEKQKKPRYIGCSTKEKKPGEQRNVKQWQCQWLNYLWWVKGKCAFNARRHPRNNHTDVSFEPFCPPIYQRDDGAWIQDTIFIVQKWHLTNKGGWEVLVSIWFGFLHKLQEEKNPKILFLKVYPTTEWLIYSLF